MSHHFSIRAVIAGLLIGILINLSNTYYGLKIGVASQMSTVSGLLGFAAFDLSSRYLRTAPLSPAENVLIISVATATGGMPVTAGFVGVVPALEYLIKPEENGPLIIDTLHLIIWTAGLSVFGLIFAAWLRPYIVEQGDLPWPGAKVTAQLVKSLHHLPSDLSERPSVSPEISSGHDGSAQDPRPGVPSDEQPLLERPRHEYSDEAVKSLVAGSIASGLLTILMSIFPILHAIPIFGLDAKREWLWFLDLAPGFVGQGIITGPVIPLHMLAGAIVGWGILSPYAKAQGYAPGPVDDWEHGSRGWIIWISLAALLADAFVKLSWTIVKPVWRTCSSYNIHEISWSWSTIRWLPSGQDHAYEPVGDSDTDTMQSHRPARPSKRAMRRSYTPIFFVAAIALCLVTMRFVFDGLLPWYYTVLAVLLSLPMAVVGIRSLAETNCNPESAAVSQLVFAWLMPSSYSNAVIVNLLSAATAQAGANQAGDLSSDLKIGSIIGARPDVQTLGQVVGSLFGAIISCLIYRFYASRNQIPGKDFLIPSSFLVLSTARLLLGRGLPDGVPPFALGAAILSAAATIVKMIFSGRRWEKYIPSGVAFAIGIYTTPSFTITRVAGGMVYWLYERKCGGRHGNLKLLASGLVLGESMASLLVIVTR